MVATPPLSPQRGQLLRLTDIEGGANVSLLLLNAHEKSERLNLPGHAQVPAHCQAHRRPPACGLSIINSLFSTRALPQETLVASGFGAFTGDHIHALRVRGAPLIGLSASLLLALLAEKGEDRDTLARSLETLRASRPTAVNLMNNLDRMKLALAQEDFVPALLAEALRLIEEDKALWRQYRAGWQHAGQTGQSLVNAL